MGTKNHPGEFDCYAAADPDEPMFIMLGRDRRAASRVRSWAWRYWWCKIFPLLVRRNLLWETIDSRVLVRRQRKHDEALQCALSMDAWRLMLDAGNAVGDCAHPACGCRTGACARPGYSNAH